PTKRIIPMRRMSYQFDESAKAWEEANEKHYKNDVYKIKKGAYYEINGE
ncbi:hypothetical protein AVEN_239398-1, partial [Araneus ventricosus]